VTRNGLIAQRRREAEAEDARHTLRRKYVWCYGTEEGEARFSLLNQAAIADLVAWHGIAARGSAAFNPGEPDWSRTAVQAARGALADLRADR